MYNKRIYKIIVTIISELFIVKTAFSTEYTFDFSSGLYPQVAISYSARTDQEGYGIQRIGYRERQVKQLLDTLFDDYDSKPVHSALAEIDDICSKCKLENAAAQLYLFDVKKMFTFFESDSLIGVDLHIKMSVENSNNDTFSVYMKIPQAGHLFYYQTTKQKIQIDTVLKDIAGERWFSTNSFCDSEFVVTVCAIAKHSDTNDTIEMKTDYLAVKFKTDSSTGIVPSMLRSMPSKHILVKQIMSGGRGYSIYSKHKQDIGIYSLTGVQIGKISIPEEHSVIWKNPSSGTFLMKSRERNPCIKKIVAK